MAGTPCTDHDLWRLTVEHSPVAMCLVGLDGTLWMPNEAFAAMIGYPIEKVRELTFQEITHPEDLDGDLALFEETLRGERSSYRMVKRYVRADGEVMWGDLSVALMRAEDGSPQHFISQTLDVTSQRQDRERLAHALDVLEQERNLAQTVLDTVDVGLVLLDPAGRAVRVNRRQHEILALAHPHATPEARESSGHFYEADGLTPLPLDQLPAARAVRGEELEDERIWVGPDPASRRALSVSARTVRDSAGAAVGAALAFSDVTDLVQALRAREVFEGSVSHELRTPLTSVLGNLEVLLDDPALPDGLVDRLEAVHRNAVRLRHLVSDLLDPAARAAGTLALVRAPVDVAALVREVADAVQPASREGGVELSVHASTPVRALVDAHRVRQVLDNLTSNALKYTDAGGSIDLRAEQLDGHVVLTVRDTGIGIADDDLQHLFDPFFRSQHARRRMSPGVGLGLGIARSIVSAHGGRLEVVSSPGTGSTFRALLPTEVDGVLPAVAADAGQDPPVPSAG